MSILMKYKALYCKPLDENQVEDILKDVFVRINKSSLYDAKKPIEYAK